MTRLEFRFFGSFAVNLDNQPLTRFRSDKARALLAYLTLEGQTPLRREMLADLLWATSDKNAARKSLRIVLVNYRKLLAPLKTSEQETDILATTRQSVAFNAEADVCWVDVLAFKALLALSKNHQHRELVRCTPCITHLEEAIQHYQGNFLAGLTVNDSPPFDEWQATQTEFYHQQALSILDTLTIHYLRRGLYQPAKQYAQQQLALEAWHEKGHYHLMQILALQGERGAALKQYQTYCDILATELNLEPAPETQDLQTQIRTGRKSFALPTFTSSTLHYFPQQFTNFVGRETEVNQVINHLLTPTCRLLTLLGSGGMGKTRLAIEATKQLATQTFEFEDGLYFALLATVTNQNQMVTLLLQVLGLSYHEYTPPRQQLLDYLREKQALLILDNFEQLTNQTGLIVDILNAAPGVKVLVTSRERLNLRAEWVLSLSGLSYPQNGQPFESLAYIEQYSSLNLFLQRASQAQIGFKLNQQMLPSVIKICRLVQGMPLAIEMATVWVRDYACVEIAEEIEQNVDFLQTPLQDVPERQRSIRAVFAYSWQRLPLPERVMLAQLSLFRGGFDLTAALTVTGGVQTTLDSLVNKSLLYSPERDTYQIHTLLRQLAEEQLSTVADPMLAHQTAVAHSTYYLNLLTEIETALFGQRVFEAVERLQQDFDNIKVAWGWAVQTLSIDKMQSVLRGLSRFYRVTGRFRQAADLFETAIQSLEKEILKQVTEETRILYGQLLVELARHLNPQSRYQEAIALIERAISLLEKTSSPFLAASAYLQWGQALWYQGQLTETQPHLENALHLATTGDLPETKAESLRALGSVALRRGDYESAAIYYQQGLALTHKLGDWYGRSYMLHSLGTVSRDMGEQQQAKTYFQQALDITRQVADRWGECSALNSLGDVYLYEGDYLRAKKHYEEILPTVAKTGDKRSKSIALTNLGEVWRNLGEYERAETYYHQALGITEMIGFKRGKGWGLICLSTLSRLQKNHIQAQTYALESLAIFDILQDKIGQGYSLSSLGGALAGLNQLAEAEQVYTQALTIYQDLGRKHLAAETRAGLARIALAQKQIAQATSYISPILTWLEKHNLAGCTEPLRVYLTCYNILSLTDPSTAQNVLHTATTILQEQATHIDDDELRQTFLTHIETNRLIWRLSHPNKS